MLELTKLVDKFAANLNLYKAAHNTYNEQSCRIEYIDPLLKLLGWDITNEKGVLPQYREVIVENYSNTADRPDYSLTLKGVTRFFVEAKRPSVDILTSKESILQSRKYGWNAKHQLTVLTNFEYLLIFDTTQIPQNTDSISAALYRKFHFSEYVQKFDQLQELLSREVVYDGRFDDYVNSHFPVFGGVGYPVDELFLKQINTWRLDLSNHLYGAHQKYKSIEVLNDVVQAFINQIVFLRMCEDKNLPLYHNLKDAITDSALMKSKLEELFRAADKRYNSGMFEGENIIFDLNNDIVIDIIESLYYPHSPYLFNIIEPSLLGRIYEVFLTEQLSLSDEGYIILSKKKDCLNRSVVSTPIEIVKYMIAKTLGSLCAGKTPDEIQRLRIADIACGSGVFLEESYNYLIQYCVQWYQTHQPEHLIELSGGRKKLPLEDKKKILLSCIYGVDLDIHAVEIAKFSLLVKLIEDETAPSVKASDPILPNLAHNIAYGNALIGNREISNLTLTTKELIDIVPFDWQKINEGNPFDAIVGNPPYVSTEGMHGLITPCEFNLYKKHYETAYKQFDKYFLFVERALQKIASHGFLCFIIPNKFFKIASGQYLRKTIASGKYLAILDDFGDAQLFADKTIYSSILLLQKSEQEQFSYTKVKSAAALWSGEESCAVTLQSDMLNELPWRLTDDFAFMKLLTKLDEEAVPITKYVDIFGGIQTSAETNKTYWFSSDEIIDQNDSAFTISKSGRTYIIEKEILKPYFKPVKKSEKGLNSYSILKTDKWIIFPYDGNGRIIPQDEMRTKYCGAYSYLLDHYDELVPEGIAPQGKRKVPHATADTWYHYGRSQHLSSFPNRIKLIVGIMSRSPMYALDTHDMLISVGGTAGYCAISKKDDSKYELEFIQAWLTNSNTERILKMVGSDFEGGFYARGIDVLKKLTIVDLDFQIPKQKAIYDAIVKETRQIYAINKQLEQSIEKRVAWVLQEEKDRLIKSIEVGIDKIYKLEFQKDD